MKKYQMVVVDDDVFFRKYINKVVRQNYSEIEIHEFPSAKHALKYLKENDADFIFTDISMPQMTGVEFIQYLKECGSQTPCVAISSFDDFAYVRETLKLGAVDYLLKHDTTERDIFRVIEVCIQICLDFERENNTITEDVERMVMGIESQKYIQNKMNTQQYIEHMKKSYLNQYYMENYFIVCKNCHIQSDMAVNLIGNKGNVEFEYTYFENTSEKYVYIVWIKNAKGLSEVNEMRMLFANQITNNEQERVGISDIGYQVDKLQYYYKQAQEAHHQSFVHKRSQIVYTHMVQDDIEPIIQLVHIMEEHLNEARILNKNNAITSVEKIMDRLYSGYYLMNDWEKATKLILNYFVKRAYNENIALESLHISDVDSVHQMLYKDKIMDWIEQFFEVYDLKRKEKGYTDLTIRVMEYIDHNVKEYIVMKDIAEELQYSGNYISKQFKVDTGLRIKEYINICKIELAKEMLSSNRYKVYEIANKLQYNTDAYFCSVFKSVTGMTVTEYINNMK